MKLIDDMCDRGKITKENLFERIDESFREHVD